MMLYFFPKSSLKVFVKFLQEIYLPTLQINMMIIIMQGNVIDIKINMLHDMISAHILQVPIFIGYNRMLIVLKIGTVYVTF